MNLSLYKKSDTTEIVKLFTQVFSDSEGEAEGARIGELVEGLIHTTAEEDIFGFVATESFQEQEQILGCIFFTRMSFEMPVEAFILSPVAIDTAHHGKGLGQELISFGLEHLRAQGVKLAITYGDPNFYSKVGFQPITEELIKAPQPLSQPHGWLGQSLEGKEIETIPGESSCVTALNNPVYW